MLGKSPTLQEVKYHIRKLNTVDTNMLTFRGVSLSLLTKKDLMHLIGNDLLKRNKRLGIC